MSEKLLIICEKPSAAENFSKALGGRTGTFNNKEYKIVNLAGHIMQLPPKPKDAAKKQYTETVGEFKHIESLPWKPEYFDFNRKVIKQSDYALKCYEAVRIGIQQGYIPVIASDIDDFREGDLLVHEVLNHMNYKGKRYREYHVDETKPKIIQALNHMKEIYVNTNQSDDVDYLTGFARSNMDYLTQSLTSMATITLQRKGYRLPGPVPFGRVQSVILIIIGDQEEAIRNYKPSSVWESRYKLDSLVLTAQDIEQYNTKEEWNPNGLPEFAKVRKVKETPGKTPPPKPYNLSSLSGVLSKKGLSLERIESLIQKMYEDGVVTYPRTSENWITTEQFNEMLPFIDRYIELLEMPTSIFTHREPRKTHVKDKGSHGALRPGLKLPKSVDELDSKYGKGASLIYKTLTERFLMMYLEDTEWIKYHYETIDTTPVFKGVVRIITKMGVEDPEEMKDDIVTSLPDCSKLAELYAHEVKSVKPVDPTIKWVLNQLEKHDVGTPATQTRTVRDMTTAGKWESPLEEKKSKLSLSSRGKIGYICAKGTVIGSVEGTRKLQAILKNVNNGSLEYDKAIHEFNDILSSDIHYLKNRSYDLSSINLEQRVQKERVNIQWKGKVLPITKEYAGHIFTPEELKQFENGDAFIIQATSKKGDKFPLKVSIQTYEYNGRTITGVKGERVLADDRVEGVWKGQTIRIKPGFMDHTFTKEELDLLFKGESISIITHKGDNEYYMVGKLEKQTYKGHSFVGFKASFKQKDD